MKISRLLMQWGTAVSLALGSLVLSASSFAGTYMLSGDLGTHDPGIAKEDIWWIGETSTNTGISIKYSVDGTTWHQGGAIFSGGLSWWHQYNGNTASTWAPDISRYNGKTNIFYAVSTFGSTHSAIGLAQATSMAAGDWVDKGIVISSAAGAGINAIDPSFITSPSGSPYLVYGSWSNGIYITALNSSTLHATGNSYRLASASGGIEGANIVKNGSYYYLFVSKGLCCQGANSTYYIAYGRSTNLLGPYLDKNGVDMKNGGGSFFEGASSGWAASGGQSVAGGRIARHRYSSSNGAPILFISDLNFVNGWPSF